jgi:hypothetical protein
MSISIYVFDNNINNPFINMFFKGGGNSQPPFIVNVFVVANAFASTLTLLIFVKFRCGFAVDKFVIDWEPKSGVVVLIWVGIFYFSLGMYCTQIFS